MARPFIIVGDSEEKPRRSMGETLDMPRRYIIRRADGELFLDHRSSRELILADFKGAQARLMGTHESLDHAAKRVGWA